MLEIFSRTRQVRPERKSVRGGVRNRFVEDIEILSKPFRAMEQQMFGTRLFGRA